MYLCWSSKGAGVRLDPLQCVLIAAETGFQGVDLLVRDVLDSGCDPHELRSRMDDLGLRGGSWPLPIDWRGPSEIFADDLTRLPEYAKIASVLGLHRCGSWVMPFTIPSVLHGSAEASIRQTRALHLERLSKVARILGDRGIELGLEVIGVALKDPQGFPFVRCYGDLDRQLSQLRRECPNVGVLLDSFQLFATGEGPEVELAWGESSIVSVHLADPLHGERERLMDDQRALPSPGGRAASDQLLERLAKTGYQGPVICEPCLKMDKTIDHPATIALATIEAARSCWPSQTS
jgi:sugar phosphate isomerase/epimerase